MVMRDWDDEKRKQGRPLAACPPDTLITATGRLVLGLYSSWSNDPARRTWLHIYSKSRQLPTVAYPELVSRGVSKSLKFKWLVKVGACKDVNPLI